MAAKKTDAEKGPLGAWAYGTRDLLDASPEEAAAAAGITYSTLRKIEGGSSRHPAKATVYALWQHYRRVGQEKGRPVEDPPPEWRGAPVTSHPAIGGDLAAAISAQAAAIQALVGEFQRWRNEDRKRIADLELAVAGRVARRRPVPAREASPAPRARQRKAG